MNILKYIFFKNVIKTNAQVFETETSKVKALYENELGTFVNDRKTTKTSILFCSFRGCKEVN